MKIFYKIICISLFATVLLLPTTTFSQASISIDHVDSLYNGKIQPDQPLRIHIRWTNNTGFSVAGGTLGYRVYLSNNGELANGIFEPPVLDTLPLGFPDMFDLVFQISHYNFDGVGADTVAMGGSQLFGGGLPNGFDGVVGHISTSVSSDFAGDSLCIDSTFHGNTGAWLWSGSSSVVPEWSGPHCYEILPSCCIGIRGNLNNSTDNQIDVSDINVLIFFMFLMGEPSTCAEEADINGDGLLDISDLVAMVDYMFLLGPPPTDCQ